MSTTFLLTVPFHSGLAHLRRTLDSVRAQTYEDWTCVVVDDSPPVARSEGGADGLVRSLSDDRISYVPNEGNLGIAPTFNRCFELAAERGAELVTVVHADDLLEPEYVATMRAAHARDPQAWCVAPRVTVIDAEGRPSRTVPDTVKALLWPARLDRLEGERGLRVLLRGQFFYCPAVSYRVPLQLVPAWDTRWEQVMDLDLYGRVLLAGGSIMLEPARVYRYRRHDGSMTQRNSAVLVRTQEETMLSQELSSAARRRGWRRAARAGQWRVTVRLQGAMQVLIMLAGRRWTLAKDALVLSVRP